MILQGFFALFSAILIGSACGVVVSRNPVHSVLFLILAFFNAAALFLLAGAEFLAMILVIVYVGAVAVLFLFVVMMLDVNFAEMREGFQRYAPVGAVVGVVLLAELALVLSGFKVAAPDMTGGALAIGEENTRAIGKLLYTDYVYLFQASGLVLLVAMIGAIVLTHRPGRNTRRQNISAQQARAVGDTLEILQVKLGAASGEFYRPKVAVSEHPHDEHEDDDHGNHDHAHGGH